MATIFLNLFDNGIRHIAMIEQCHWIIGERQPFHSVGQLHPLYNVTELIDVVCSVIYP